MCAKLSPTRLYSCDPGSLVFAELYAYASALQPICDLLFLLEQEAFFSSASSFGLDAFERLSGPVLDFLPVADRRARLIGRASVTPNDYSSLGIQNALLSVGIRSSVCESADRSVYVHVLSADRDLSQDQIVSAASQFLPAHAPFLFDFRPLSWDFIDQNDLSFLQCDQKDLSWDDIDNYFP